MEDTNNVFQPTPVPLGVRSNVMAIRSKVRHRDSTIVKASDRQNDYDRHGG